jgi:hypothetical protein
MSTNPDFSFGIIGDTQFCYDEDGMQFGDPSRVRRYSASLPKFETAVKYFKDQAKLGPLPCCILLGDVVDGKTKRDGNSNEAMEEFRQVLNRSNGIDNIDPTWHFIVGNHDLYSFTREDIYNNEFYIPNYIRSQGNCNSKRLYYSFKPFKGYRFIVLDPFEISTCGANSTDNEKKANDIINNKNPNIASGGDWLEGLNDYDKRYVPYNGAVSDEQLLWLQNELNDSKAGNSSSSLSERERVIVFTHCPLYEKCCRGSAITWNSDEILLLLRTSGNCIACFYGHDHDGGYAQDASGIHHIVPPAVLEAQVPDNAHGLINVHHDSSTLVMNWMGKPPPSDRFTWPTEFSYKHINCGDASSIDDSIKAGTEAGCRC